MKMRTEPRLSQCRTPPCQYDSLFWPRGNQHTQCPAGRSDGI